MSDYHDDDTFADLPGGLSLSESKLRLLQPELFGWRGWLTTTRWAGDILTSAGTRKMIAEHLFSGDANPAFVVTTEPEVVVGAYTDELDAIVLLRFDPFWNDLLHLVPDLRLLTINTYGQSPFISSDLEEGPRSLRRWTSVYPLIAETLSDDIALIQQRKAALNPALWERAHELLLKAKSAERVRIRGGSPLRSRGPGTSATLRRG